MRKRITIGLGIVSLMAFAGDGLVPGQVQAADKVDICHFSGHESDGGKGASPDFLIGGMGGPKGGGDEKTCKTLGGNVISVSVNGAVNGHGVDLGGKPR